MKIVKGEYLKYAPQLSNGKPKLDQLTLLKFVDKTLKKELGSKDMDMLLITPNVTEKLWKFLLKRRVV